LLARPFLPLWRSFLRFAYRPLNQTALFTGVTVGLVLFAYTFPPAGLVANGLATAPPPPPGWLTFRQAVQLTEPVIQQTTHGPWNISLAEGVASTSAWSPALSMWGANSTLLATVSTCQSFLTGQSVFTFWSDSLYPAASGPAAFSSGAAGLWTFVYLNPTHSALVISVLHGSVITNGIVRPNSACSHLGGPFAPTTSYLNITNASDPSSFAPSTANWLAGQEGADGAPTAAYYILGNPIIPVAYIAHGYNQEWATYYSACGAPGINGQVTYSGAPISIPKRPGYVEELTFGSYCYQTMAAVSPGHKTIWSAGTTFYAEWPLTVTLATSGVLGAGVNSLNTSQFRMEMLLNSSLGPFSVPLWTGDPYCAVGVQFGSNCQVAELSWYAALVSPSGTVLNTFPAFAGSNNWTVQGMPITTGENLVVVSSVPVFGMVNSGIAFESGLTPFVCCGVDFGPDLANPGPVQL